MLDYLTNSRNNDRANTSVVTRTTGDSMYNLYSFIGQEYLLSLLLPVYNSVGFEDLQEDDIQTQLLRDEVVTWACNLGHRSCRDEALRLFRTWMVKNETFE